jgi:hypothetical protein
MNKSDFLSIKFFCFVILAVVFFTASFHLFNAVITNETLGIAIMMLLLALFVDLKKFNFWGLTGEKVEAEIKKVEGKSGIDVKAVPKPTTKEVTKAETVTLQSHPHRNESLKGNFLTLVYDLERIMRVAAAVIEGKDSSAGDVQEILKQTGLLKDIGVQQLQLIRRIKNLLLQGKDAEMDDSLLSSATKIAASLYKELNAWLLNSPK